MASAICFVSTPIIGYKMVALLLLTTVSFLAMAFDIFPVLFAALLSALLWNFFFIPPIYTFHIDNAEDLMMFLLYFIVAAINTVLSYKLRIEEKKARDKEEKEKTILLYNTLLNSLSHELRTPISTILGASDTLKENEANLSIKQRSELLNEIENASLRLNRQVENLLNMSRLESGMLEAKIDWCDVNEIINSMLHKLQATAHQQLLYSENQQLPLFKLDAGFLEQILHNILLNAIQYTPSHSTITVTAQHDDKNCMITISDNGPGIPVEELHLIFNKFHRVPNTKTGGSGLGLSIAKGFVEALGGNIRVTNNTQAGAQFTVTIPSEMNHLNHLKNE